MWWTNTSGEVMKILVCGGRDFDDFFYFMKQMDKYINLPVHVISGGAKGADSFAITWALIYDKPYTKYKADWDTRGKAAGPIRNQQMLDEGKPDLVVAFPTAKSRGTWDMIKRAERVGVKTIIVKGE
jgi:hypothetical protein